MTEDQRLKKLARTARWKRNNRERVSAYNKEHHASHKHELKYKRDENTRLHRQEKSKELRRVANASNNNMAQAIRRRESLRRREIKEIVITAYGGKCSHCGETNHEFMTLDHVNDDGKSHRDTEPTARNSWKWAKSRNFPATLQLMCMSCNMAKTRTSSSSRSRLREEVFSAYGGKCSCCDETNILKLTLDHILGGGCEHRRSLGLGGGLIRWAKRSGFPSILRCLCANCNLSSYFGGGICAHKRSH